METGKNHRAPIIPRENLHFGFGPDTPRYWFGGDPFKTRFFDVLSLRLPDGERFAVSSVRDYREAIKDPALLKEVNAFIRQEGQHSMVHRKLNERLELQGIAVQALSEQNRKLMERLGRMRKPLPLAQTVAGEHLTATFAHLMLEHPDLFSDADAQVCAVFAWHSAEEIEHKAVAYDVMQKIAGSGYLTRATVCAVLTPAFFLHTFRLMDALFIQDGFSAVARARLWLNGMRWLLGRHGPIRRVAGHYLAFYRPGFHPWETGAMKGYEEWLQTFDLQHDPVAASRRVLGHSAAKPAAPSATRRTRSTRRTATETTAAS